MTIFLLVGKCFEGLRLEVAKCTDGLRSLEKLWLSVGNCFNSSALNQNNPHYMNSLVLCLEIINQKSKVLIFTNKRFLKECICCFANSNRGNFGISSFFLHFGKKL